MARFGRSVGLQEGNLVKAFSCLAMTRFSLGEISSTNNLLQKLFLCVLNGVGGGFSGFVS
jgi:hypothetical protein